MADEKEKKEKKPQQPKGEGKAKGDGKGKGKDKAPEVELTADGKPARPKASSRGTARMREKFEKEVRPALMKEFELTNPMAVPTIVKVVVNMGVGEATQNAKLIDPASAELGQITGQKPIVTKAKKSIAAFKVREGMPIGVMVTLSGDRSNEF